MPTASCASWPTTVRWVSSAAWCIAAGRAQLEASGGITLENVRAVADTGVDRISIGSLTKDLAAVDYSLRFEA